jgi:hypothetical protein
VIRIVQETFLYNIIGIGGGKIKYKSIIPVLMLLAIVLAFGISSVSAADSTSTTTSSQSGATVVSPKVTFTSAQINAAASKVKTYVETNNKLPSSVTVNNRQVTIQQFLLLMTENTAGINKGSKASITLKNVKKPANPSQSLKSGTLSKTEYLSIANKVTSSIKSTGSAPNYVSTSLGKMRYETIVYSYAKILNFHAANKRLPNTVSVKPWSTAKPATEGSPETIDAIFKKAAKYGYSSAAHDATGLMRIGAGDCWAMSDYLFKQLKASKVKARIVQYATAYASNHRSVQYYKNGAWIDVPYRSYGFHVNFRNTSASICGKIISSC